MDVRHTLIAVGILLLIVGSSAFLQTCTVEQYLPGQEGRSIKTTIQPKSEYNLFFELSDKKTIVEIRTTVQQKAILKIRLKEKSIYKRAISPGEHSWNVTLGGGEGRYRLVVGNPNRAKLMVYLHLRFFLLTDVRIRPHIDASFPVIFVGLSTTLLGAIFSLSFTSLLTNVFLFLVAASFLHTIGFVFNVPSFFLSSLLSFIFIDMVCTGVLLRWIRSTLRTLHGIELSFILGVFLSIQTLIAALLIPLYLGRTGLVAEREITYVDVDPNPMLGVCDHLESGTAETILRNHLRLTRSLGANWVRLDMAWEEIEPVQDMWKFDFWDTLVRVSSHYGLRILPVVSRTPRWASSRPDSDLYYTYPPRDLKDFGDFIQTVVERYGKKLYYWEIWNEPDAQFWRGSTRDYCKLLEEARSASKMADPTARLVLGGISSEGIPFLEQLSLLNALDLVDVVGIHLYGKEPDDVSEKFEKYLDVMNRSGITKPIWITEIGQPTLPQYKTEDPQAEFLRKSLLNLFSNTRVEKIFWYELKDSGMVRFWREHNFGLVRFDLTPKASYEAYLRIANSIFANRSLGTRKT
jgi:hypothetical protein